MGHGDGPRCRFVDRSTDPPAGALDAYIEAHVHGDVRFDEDVEALVLDPCFRGTNVEPLADRFPCYLEWHHGFRLAVEELLCHPEYRGQDIVQLGVTLAVDGYVDARIIGAAAEAGQYEPQALKRAWHYVARFGGAVE